MLKSKRTIVLFVMMALISLFSSGCVGVRSFPSAARAGDTVTIAAGYLDGMDRTNTTVTITDSNSVIQDITGNIRAVFYLYPDPTSNTWNYSIAAYLEDPKQATVVVDLPDSNMLPTGDAEITIDSTAPGFFPITSNITILPGQGTPEVFEERSWGAQDITDLEPLHQAKVTFSSSVNIGAVEMEIDFDETVIQPQSINVITHKYSMPDFFQGAENMFYWDDDGDVLRVRIVCPQGTSAYQLWFNIVYPANISVTDPFSIVSGTTRIVDVDGNVIPGAAPALTHKYQ